MLYDVPQTDDASETAMASLIARLRASLPKSEALSSVTDAVCARHLADAVALATSALGDRVPIGSSVTRWDAALDGVARTLAAWSLYNFRGRTRQAGADEGIDLAAKDAQSYLSRLRSPDRQEQPAIVLSPGGVPADAPLVSTSPTAHTWARSRRTGRAP